jgi:uncharacterized radical SAM protein YgiQ
MIENGKKYVTNWLPITRDEMLLRGWDEVDIIIVSGDAYVDHPSFGNAVIARILEHGGYKVAIIPQPNWRDDLRDFKKFGKPRLFFGVTAGCMDSMVNHYTANKRLRSDDAYTPGGVAGFRPDYASVVYSKILKQIYPDVPVILGGIEASLRRLAHYDYWSDSFMPGLLAQTPADLLVFGMGEKTILEIAQRLDQGIPLEGLRDIEQTVYYLPERETPAHNNDWKSIELPSYEVCKEDKKKHAESFRIFEQESNKWQGARLIEKTANRFLVVNPAFPPMTTEEIDASFDLPYTRLPHPKYLKRGPIPAYEMIRHSVNIHRGCFGSCAFCTISAHQGKFVVSRSEKSILDELNEVVKMPDFKGYISDLGGPSANMYLMRGMDEKICRKCARPSCIYPAICPNLNADHHPLTGLYRKAAQVPGIKKVFVGSGIRYDMLVGRSRQDAEKNGVDEYMRQLVSHHVSGRLKVAPEHTSENVLKVMRKPSFKLFHEFKRRFEEENRIAGLRQQLIPYFISSHPGSTVVEMAELAAETKDMGFQLEQVQNFTPTPMTLATVMFYTGFDPYTLQPIFTARKIDEKKDQQIFFFWYKNENRAFIRQKLMSYNRPDLVQKLLK